MNFILGIDRNALTVSSPLVQQALGIDPLRMAELITISTAVYALLQIPSGWLTERIGVRYALAGACLMWSIATVLTAFQTHLGGFFAVRILLGIGQAPDWVACIFALKLLFSDKEREAASSLLLGGLYVGYTASGALTAYVMQTFGWRNCFLIYGVIGLVFSAIVFLCYGGPSVEGQRQHTEARPQTPHVPVAWREMLLPVAQISVFYGGVCSVQGFFHVTFPHFMMDHHHLSAGQAGRLFSIPWASLYGSVLLWGMVIRVFKRRETAARPFPAAHVRLFGIIGAAAFLASGILCSSLWGAMTLFVLAMSGVGLCQVLTWSHVQSFPRATAVVAGCTALVGNWMSSVGPVWTEMVFKSTHVWSPVAALMLVYGTIAGGMWLLPNRSVPDRDEQMTPVAGAEFE
ncbi:major facilitator superfamily transporter [Ameyamaea chiangmaiensis NBRC 103196]|nr:major facilitator superfamily transporter [Ameyamaea chiangmaiensis NBRC 103196]